MRRLTGVPPLPPNPVRRRHAFKFAALWMLAVAVLFWAGQPLAATVLGAIALPLCTLVTVVHLCVFSEMLAFYDHHRINQGGTHGR